MAFLWVAVLLKKCQCNKPRVALCLDWGWGVVNFCSMVLYCQVGAWWSAEKRVIAWVLLNEADEMMLILLHLLFASFCLTHILRASGALHLLFSLQVDDTSLNVLGTECFIILSLLFPYYLCLPLPTPFTAEAPGTQWG